MTPQKQLFRHEPEKGVYGDCWRTAIACLLDLRPSDVPHFLQDHKDTEADRLMAEFLHKRGFHLVSIAFQQGDHEGVLNYMKHCNPRLFYLLSGTSRNGCGHVVICQDDKIVFDPALDESGIVGPMEDGNFWINFLTCVSQIKLREAESA